MSFCVSNFFFAFLCLLYWIFWSFYFGFCFFFLFSFCINFTSFSSCFFIFLSEFPSCLLKSAPMWDVIFRYRFKKKEKNLILARMIWLWKCCFKNREQWSFFHFRLRMSRDSHDTFIEFRLKKSVSVHDWSLFTFTFLMTCDTWFVSIWASMIVCHYLTAHYSDSHP